MLIETYLVLTVMAWAFLVVAYCFKSKAKRVILQLLSLILFTSLALASADIETVNCVSGSVNETTADYYNISMECNTYSHYDEGVIWVNAGLATVLGVLVLVTAFSSFEGLDDE